MKRKVAKEILVDSFFELAETVPIDKIKIKDITENCSYSPATFYRQFKDKTDLIIWAYKRDFDEVVKKGNESDSSIEEMILALVVYFGENKDYYSEILNSEKADELFIKPMVSYHFELLKAYSQERNKENLSMESEMILRAFVVGALSIIFDWIIGIWDTTAEEISHTCVKALPREIIQI